MSGSRPCFARAFAFALFVLGGTARAADPKTPPSKPSARATASRAVTFLAPPPPLAMLPSLARVAIEIVQGQLIVVEDVILPRGEWQGESLDFYVAFGSPGAPRAIDAHLLPIGDGALEPEDGASGEPLVVDRAPRRPVTAHALLGKDTMAGVVVHVKHDALAKALAPGQMAALRLRTVLDLPEEDSVGARGVVVRLGASRGTPLTLGRVALLARAGVKAPTRVEARLCGPDADATPLAVTGLPRLDAARVSRPVVAPVLAVRQTSDDLCLRFWLAY